MPRRTSRDKPRSATSGRGKRSRWVRWIAVGTLLVLVVTIIPIATLKFTPPLTSAFMIGSFRQDPATGLPCEHVAYEWTPSSSISLDVPRAMIVAEDQRFFLHHGFDTKAIQAALDDYIDGAPMRGASTLTQQTAKNLFLWPGRSLLRKGIEAWLTLWIELLWSKERIVEVYANIAQFGPCLFGVEAASQRYFGASASSLTAREASLLAAVLPAPGRMRPDRPGTYTSERAAEIQAEMRRGGGPSYLRPIDEN